MDSQHHPPQPLDACSSIVQSLLHYSRGEIDFSRRAIESLVKKMKEKPVELDALIKAVTTGGKEATPCVTIQRTLDGRLQVAGRKGFPHVIYAKIWRWPDLSRNELRPTQECALSFDLRCDVICVNPYHYERVVESPGLDISRLSINTPDEMHMIDPSSRSPTVDTIQQHCSIMLAESHINHHVESMVPTAISCSVQSISPPAKNHILLPPCSSKPLPDHWCSISYFELDQQVGETFKVLSIYPGVTIDGYTNPSMDDRFCIGFLNNIHRPPNVQKARLHIGRGVRLEARNEGDVWLENLSDNAVFLSSPYLDRQSRRPIGNAVHKIYPRASLKVFDLYDTHQLLSQKAEQARQAAAAEAAAVSGTVSLQIENTDPFTSGEIGVDDLRRFCALSMSFVKGWGQDYPRASIKNCPCWIEVHLYRALQILDDVLQRKL